VISTLASYIYFGIAPSIVLIITLLVTLFLHRDDLPVKHTASQEELTATEKVTSKIANEMSKNAVSAAEVSSSIDKLQAKASHQVVSIHQISDTADTINITLGATTEAATGALNAARAMNQSSEDGLRELSVAVESMSSIEAQTSDSTAKITALNEQVERIKSVASVIEDIASQTNLLALNAAIEAARAGELGRGFAVVADEVRKLAERTSTSTDEVTHIVQNILNETSEVIGTIGTLSDKVAVGTTNVNNVATRLQAIASQSRDVEFQVEAINDGVVQNESGLATIVSEVKEMNLDLEDTETQLRGLQSEAETLMEIAEHANGVIVESDENSLHRPIYDIALMVADQVKNRFESDIGSKKVTEQALFNREYSIIAGTKPEKFETSFDKYCDAVLPEFQEHALTRNNAIVYVIATDNNGYVPTHNNQYCQPLTGNYDKDIVSNRTKRKFTDRVGSRCGQHTQPMLLQTYKRDTGEIMHDLSVPLYVNGKHWGGIRVGYKPLS
jgi:methyl-accepting chemotaxis protein